MKNILLDSQIFPKASIQETNILESVLKNGMGYSIDTVHKKGNYLISCKYDYSDFVEGFEIPTVTDIESGIICIFDLTNKQIVDIVPFGFNTTIKPEEISETLINKINFLIKEEHNKIL